MSSILKISWPHSAEISTGFPTGLCDPRDQNNLPGGGWWGSESASLTQVNQCQTNDLPAGLHWIHYRHPKDENRPDNVTIIRTTHVKFDTKSIPTREKNGSRKVGVLESVRGRMMIISEC